MLGTYQRSRELRPTIFPFRQIKVPSKDETQNLFWTTSRILSSSKSGERKFWNGSGLQEVIFRTKYHSIHMENLFPMNLLVFIGVFRGTQLVNFKRIFEKERVSRLIHQNSIKEASQVFLGHLEVNLVTEHIKKSFVEFWTKGQTDEADQQILMCFNLSNLSNLSTGFVQFLEEMRNEVRNRREKSLQSRMGKKRIWRILNQSFF